MHSMIDRTPTANTFSLIPVFHFLADYCCYAARVLNKKRKRIPMRQK